jgi:cobaltochelatase CobN
MNKKAISLCIILFILIMCTTVSASDLTTTDSNDNVTNTIKDTNTINTVNVEVKDTVQTPTSQTKTLNNESNTITETTNEQQDVQTANEQKKIIIKEDSSNIDVKTDTIQSSTGLNITGIVTTAYNKTSKKYAPDEDEGFIAEGAKVTLYDESTGNSIGITTTDSNGTYQFTNLSSGYYALEFEFGTYAIGEESIHLTNYSQERDYIFIPDLDIITFSGDSSGDGQSEKIKYLSQISDRFLFLESYELNNSYDKSGQWMLDHSNFILVDMYSVGNGFGINDDLIAKSPASRNHHLAYVFGLFDEGLLKGPLGNWGFLGNNPHSIENTYVGSYWQTASEANSTIIKTNMENLFSYIKFLLGETDVDPTTTGHSPLLLSSSWGLYYPGYENNVKTPTPELINQWILTNPGYNSDNSGSLNWMTEDYSRWNLENNNPATVLRNFEDWYTENKKEFDGPFIIISTYYEGGKVVDALIKEYEKQGRAVFSIYKTSSEQPDMTSLLETAGNKTVLTRGVSAVSYMYWWTTGYSQRGGNYTINAYKNLNVSLINALKDISSFSFESQYGPQNEWTAAVTMPEFEGVFGALPVSYVNENKETVVIPEGIAKHVQLTNGWAKLRELNNSDKKISILVYGYPPGKANIGASFLDVFQSLHDLIEHMYDEGYDIGMNKSEIPTTEELNNIITDFSNKGLWAEGLLDTYVITHYDELVEYGQLVSLDQYLEWYNALPITLQEHVTQSWGSGLGNGSMIYREKAEINKTALNNWLSKLSENYQDEFKHYWNTTERKIIISQDSENMLINKTEFYKWLYDLPSNLQKVFEDSVGSQLLNETKYREEGYFVVPGVHYGNIFLSVQPMRGWESQMDFHTSDLSPPQQYIAYYKYLSQIYKTDAIIHMGTHGTLEWLPGRSLGLQSTDWPFQLTETPIVYPYIVSNPGEGMTAKERSFAQVLTHMTPVTASTSLYGDYVELNDAISRYDSNKKAGANDNLEYYKELILNLTDSLGYDQPDYMVVSGYLENYYIALNNEDENATEEAKKQLIQKATILGFVIPENEGFETELQKLEEYLNDSKAFEEWLAEIHSSIEEMSSDKINFGMHTLGKIWNDTEMITGVMSIVSSRTEVLEHIMNMYYPEIKESYYDKIKDRNFNVEKDVINGVLKNIITSIVEGSTVNEIAEQYGIFDNTTDIYQDFLLIEETINNILDNNEWRYIFTALSGGYVEPALSADPLYSDVLPTGGSMYASDTTKIPSKSAWQSAVNSIDAVLEKYMIGQGEETFPEMVGEVIWGTEVLRTEGISLAQFLYLLGVKPTWDKTGTVTGIEVIPLEELTLTIDGTVYNRPRIDVFSTIVSNNPGWISLLTSAVSMVNDLNESTNDNFVKKHYNETGSLERLFGLPGAVLEGTGVSDLLNNVGASLNDSEGIATKLADVYESRIGHSWNVDDSGNIIVQDDQDGLTYLLEHVELVIQNLDSTWRYLDSDDYVDWYGGLLNAANVHGSVVNTVLLDIRDKNNVVLSSLGEEVKKETRTTILNPQWLGGMTTDVGGWNQMAQNFENLMKTMLSTQEYKENQAGKAILDTNDGNNAGIVGDGLLKEVAKLVVYSDYFDIDAQYKSYALQSMVGWLLTSDMYSYWKTTDNTLRKDLLQKYVDNANRYGVACCHHTCGNINFHEWVLKTGAALGVSGLSEYSKIYASATKNPDAVYSENPGSTPSQSTDGTGTVDISEGIGEYVNNGATGEANANARAGAGATGVSGSTSITGMAQTMTKVNNGGSGSGANTDAQTGNGTSGGTSGEGSGAQNSTGDNNGTGTGNGTSEDTGNSSSTSGNSSSSESTSNQTEVDTNSTTPAENTNSTAPVEETNSTAPTENTNSTAPVEETNTTAPSSNNTEEPKDTETNVTVPETQNNPEQPQQNMTDNTNSQSDDKNKHNTTVVDNTGAGEKPSSDTSPSESTPAESEPSSSAGITLTSGSSSSGGESGSTAGAVAMYEVVKKNVGEPPTPQSEISVGYLLFIVGLLLIFFFGFTRPNNRSK